MQDELQGIESSYRQKEKEILALYRIKIVLGRHSSR